MASPAHETDLDRLSPEEWRADFDALATQCQARLHRCFATKAEDFKSTRVSFMSAEPPPRVALLHEVYFPMGTVAGRSVHVVSAGDDARLQFLFPEGDPIEIVCGWDHDAASSLAGLSDKDKDDLRKRVASGVSLQMARRSFAYCVIFPAERLAIDVFANELALKRFERGGERPLTRYPWPNPRQPPHRQQPRQPEQALRDALRRPRQELERAVLGGTGQSPSTVSRPLPPTRRRADVSPFTSRRPS